MTDTWTRGTAWLSADRAYRYVLTRRWDDGPVMAWIMLNPSTADADTNDPTIRRCIGFARREGCGAIWVVNLFALRATDPRVLRASPDPVGPANDSFLRERTRTDYVVAAWGAHGSLNGRSHEVRTALADIPLLCLGITRGGEPRHPLYVQSDTPLVRLPDDNSGRASWPATTSTAWQQAAGSGHARGLYQTRRRGQ